MPHVVTLGRVPGVVGAYGNIVRHPDYEPVADLLVLRLEAPLFYANATGSGTASSSSSVPATLSRTR